MGKNFVECSIDETYNAPVSTAESKKRISSTCINGKPLKITRLKSENSQGVGEMGQ